MGEWQLVFAVIAGCFYYEIARHFIKEINQFSRTRYTVHVIKDIFYHDQANYDTYFVKSTLRRTMDLPFTPTIGVSIRDDNIKLMGNSNKKRIVPVCDDLSTGPITSITFYDGDFYCEVEPYEMTRENHLGAILQRHLEEGWEIKEPCEHEEQSITEWKKKEEEKFTS